MAGYKKPINKVLVAGNPLLQELKVEGTVTYMLPGRLVIVGTAEQQCKVGTAAGKVLGFLGYEQASDHYKPATVDTAYALADFAPVLNGGGFVIVASLAASQGTIVKGDRLVAAANGELSLASAATITIASGTTTVLSDKAQPDEAVAGAYGAEGLVVAIAEEGKSNVGSSQDIMVRSLI